MWLSRELNLTRLFCFFFAFQQQAIYFILWFFIWNVTHELQLAFPLLLASS